MSRPNSRPNSRPSSRPQSPTSPRRGKTIVIKVLMLDNTVNTFHVAQKASGRHLYEDVVNKLQLLEADYFDLEYINPEGVPCWLDHDKPVLKQVGSPQELNFRFGVKFYTPDPGLLEDEYTRYLFALQIKRDLQTGVMPCNENTAALLASYITQAELGDFIDEFTDQSYFQSCKIMQNQTPKIEEKIIDHHKIHIGMTPAEADFNLLDTARKVELYGIKMCSARVSTDHESCGLNLACAHMGVLVFQNYTKINTFSWAKIRKLSFKRKKFLIKLHPEGYFQLDFTAITEGFYKDTVEFYFETRNDCKNFWKRCIEHHAFFRCQSVKRLPRNKTRVVSRGSSFRYGGRTQKQLVEWVRENHAKRAPFDRSASARLSSRAGDGVSVSRTSTLNTADHHQSHNSTSSGSHTLDVSSKDNIDHPRIEHQENVDIHSSHSSVGSPTRRSEGDMRSLDRESVGLRSRELSLDKDEPDDLPPPPPPPPLQHETGTNSESVLDNDNVQVGGDLYQNEFNIPSQPKLANDTSGYNICRNAAVDDDQSSHKGSSLEDNQAVVDEQAGHAVSSMDVGPENVGPQQEPRPESVSKPGDLVSKGRSSVASSYIDSMEDIPYVLHRIPPGSQPVEFIKTSPQVAPMVKPEKRYVNTVPPQNQIAKPKPCKPKPCKSKPCKPVKTSKSIEEKRKHEEHMKQIKTVLQNPVVPKSPGRVRAFNTVPRHVLPSPNSFSCKDDSMSPSLEKQILEHMKRKQAQMIANRKQDATPTNEPMDDNTHMRSPLVQCDSISDDEAAQMHESAPDMEREALLAAMDQEQFILGLAPVTAEQAVVICDSETSSEDELYNPDLDDIRAYLQQEQEQSGLPPIGRVELARQYSVVQEEDGNTMSADDDTDVYSQKTDEALMGVLPSESPPCFLESPESTSLPSDRDASDEVTPPIPEHRLEDDSDLVLDEGYCEVSEDRPEKPHGKSHLPMLEEEQAIPESPVEDEPFDVGAPPTPLDGGEDELDSYSYQPYHFPRRDSENLPPPPVHGIDFNRRISVDDTPLPPPPPSTVDAYSEGSSNLTVPILNILAATPEPSSEDDETFPLPDTDLPEPMTSPEEETPVPESITPPEYDNLFQDDVAALSVDTSESDEDEEIDPSEDIVDFFEKQFDSIEQECDLDMAEITPRESPEFETELPTPIRTVPENMTSSSSDSSLDQLPLHNGIDVSHATARPEAAEDSGDVASREFEEHLYNLESLDRLTHPDMMHYSSEDDMSSDCGSEELLDPCGGDTSSDELEDARPSHPPHPPQSNNVRDLARRFERN